MKSLRLPAAVAPHACRFRLRIGRSGIQGLGVFADEPIPARRKVIEYTGTKVAWPALKRRLQKIMKEGGWMPRYLFRLGPRSWIDGETGGSGAERVNHCCDPNLVVRRSRGRIFYWSKRRIARGQELTIDYRYRATARRKACRCGSPNCRGTINLFKPAKTGAKKR